MLRLLFDQNFNHDILRGLLLRLPDVDVVTALQAGLDEAPDPELLDWAAQQRRTVVTHDVNTTAGSRIPAYQAGRTSSRRLCCPSGVTDWPGN